MNMEAPAVTTVERLVDSAPDIIDKVSSMFSKKNKEVETPAEPETEFVGE